MSLQEDMENQASGTGFILEVPEVNIPQFTGVDGKDEIQRWMNQRMQWQNRTELRVPERRLRRNVNLRYQPFWAIYKRSTDG